MERYNLEIKYKGKLTAYGTPYLKVKIKGLNLTEPTYLKDGFDSILDTGSVKNNITPQFAKALNLKPIYEDVGLYPLAKEPSVTNVYEIRFFINGIEKMFTEEFNEMPYHFQFPIIFGTEFLKKCNNLEMDFIKDEYVLEL